MAPHTNFFYSTSLCDDCMHELIDFMTTHCCLVFESTFRDVEQGKSYTIEIGYWSGTIPDFIIGRVELTLVGPTSEFALFRLALITHYHTYFIV